MNTIPWYQSAIIRQQIVQMISAGLLLLGISTEAFDVDQTVTMVFGGVTALVAIWTLITRLRKPTPPITETAVERTVELAKKQGGMARVALLCFALALAAPVAVITTACTGTTSAYRQAENPAELAYVLTEHYAALVRAAADLRDRPGTPPAAVAAMQRADQLAKPVVLRLRPLRDAYVLARSAASEAELQAAIDQAVIAISELVKAVNAAREKP